MNTWLIFTGPVTCSSFLLSAVSMATPLKCLKKPTIVSPPLLFKIVAFTKTHNWKLKTIHNKTRTCSHCLYKVACLVLYSNCDSYHNRDTFCSRIMLSSMFSLHSTYTQCNKRMHKYMDPLWNFTPSSYSIKALMTIIHVVQRKHYL